MIISPFEQTPSMERHRRDQITIPKELGTSPFGHMAERPGNICTIDMLETQDHATRTIIIGKGGARGQKLEA